MTQSIDILRGELERLFELDELKKLCTDILDLDPSDMGAEGKGAFARALVERCKNEDRLLALTDALLLSKPGVNPKVRGVFDAEPGDELKTGANVGPYRVMKKIGEGGVGVVYVGEKKDDAGNTTRVAIKVVRPVHARDRAAVQRWLAVARILKSVDDPSLAPVLDVGTLEDGRPWIATAFIDGQSLSQRIGRTGPMHYNEARPIVRGVLSALETLHARGLVHGDVKPENVFMVRPTASDKMKNEPTGVIVDAAHDRLFARTGVGAAQSGVLPVFGTAKVIAPELARGGGPSASADLYSAGCLLYEVLTGRPPFTGDSSIEVVAYHVTSDATPPSVHAPRGWVAKDLDQIVLRALAKDPKERFKDAAAFREALESIGRASIPPEARKVEALDDSKFEKAANALKEKPSDEELAVALERVVEPSGAWDKAVDVMKEAAAAAEDADAKKALYYRVARIAEADLGKPDVAEDAYRKILEIDETEEIARVGIEELKRASGDAEGLVELLLEKAEKEESASERAPILREIAELYEKSLGDDEAAFGTWVHALSEDPRDERAVHEIERLAGDNVERYNEAVHSINEMLEHTEDVATKVAMYVLLGRWYADRLARPDFAVPCFGEALALDPANDGALEGTIALYRKAQSWQELVTMLLQRAESSSNPARARDFRAEAAEVVHKKLNDPARAAEVYEKIVEADPAHPKASESLELIYTERGDWKKLAAALERKSRSQKGEDRTDTLCAIAELYEDRLDDADQAAAHFELALANDPRNLGALKGLERIYAKGGKMHELLGNLEKQLEIAATPRQKLALLERMGSMQLEEFVDHQEAADCFQRVVEIEPGHEGANTALARVYRHLQRFDDLAKTLERHALGTEDEARKIGLFIQAAKVLMVDVGAPERALAMAERVTGIKPKHTEALELIARLQAQTGDASKALEATDHLAEDEKDPVKRADLLVRAGKILEERGDKDSAIERYKRALDTHPQNTKAASALRAIYASRGDAHGAAELLEREIAVTEGATAKARLYAELGELRRDRLEDPAKAKEAWTAALKLDGTCTPAARGLGDMAFAAGQWEAAAKYYEPLLARTGEMPVDVARDIGVRCGDAFRKLGEHEKAQRAYLNAKAFAADDKEVLERVAEVTFESGAPDEAAELYRDLLKQFGGDLIGGDKGRILWHLGEALRRSDELDEAEKVLTEAADLMAADPARPLTSLRALYETKSDWENVVRTLRRRMEIATDDERYDLLVETGDLLLAKMGDRAKASKSYVAALEIRGDDRNLLTKLMAVYSENKDWSKLVEVILRIAELVDDSKQLSKYYNTAAAICHFELNRLEEAADYYEQAIEHDPSLNKSFEGLVTALTSQSGWERLEEAYRNRIKRVGDAGDASYRATLWDQLGELLLTRLEKKAEAVEALEEAHKLDPENRRRAETLAESYGAEPKRYFARAVRVHQDLLRLSPYRIESYQALRKLYTEVKRPDESWCVCQALTVLKSAEPDEESFFKKHRRREPAAAAEVVSHELWVKNLMHPEQDPLLTDIFATITPAVIATRGQPLSSFGLDAKDKRDPENDDADMARTLHYAAAVLSVPLPSVFYRKDDAGGLSFVFSNPPAIGLGKGALAGGPGQALAFVAGRQLAYLRPGHYLRMLVPTGGGLRSWLLAAIKSAVGQFPVPKEQSANVDENLAAFKKHLTAPQQETLKSHVHKLLGDPRQELDLKKWVAGVDLTADRAGFVLANDLELTGMIVRASPDDAASLPQKDRLKELHLYSVSEEYLSLRHKLGIAIGG
jgi:tetratricopeptide (TPR) repeat protein